MRTASPSRRCSRCSSLVVQVNIAGHSLGGNVVLHYAGVRPARARTVISLDGFGVRAEGPDEAPAKLAKWLDAIAESRQFATMDFDVVADRLQNNPRLPRAKAAFLARHWAESLADGRVLASLYLRHRLPFPTVYRIQEM